MEKKKNFSFSTKAMEKDFLLLNDSKLLNFLIFLTTS